MKGAVACLAVLACMAAACAAPANDVPPAAEPEAAAPAGEGDKIVSPEWDALDRVEDSCGIEGLKPYLGKPAADLPDGLLKPRDRVLGPTSQATMDYSPERLNVLTNADGIIIGLKCG
ncbi:MAG: I78 family peptidase inhibitor [Hyphomonas sp.]